MRHRPKRRPHRRRPHRRHRHGWSRQTPVRVARDDKRRRARPAPLRRRIRRRAVHRGRGDAGEQPVIRRFEDFRGRLPRRQHQSLGRRALGVWDGLALRERQGQRILNLLGGGLYGQRGRWPEHDHAPDLRSAGRSRQSGHGVSEFRLLVARHRRPDAERKFLRRGLLSAADPTAVHLCRLVAAINVLDKPRLRPLGVERLGYPRLRERSAAKPAVRIHAARHHLGQFADL